MNPKLKIFIFEKEMARNRLLDGMVDERNKLSNQVVSVKSIRIFQVGLIYDLGS